MYDNIESDEREEGEIVDDDDDLEDVSDSSIGSPLHPGKSVSPTEHLRGISLSSISDEDLENRRIKHGTRKSIRMQHRRYEALEVHLTKHPKNKTERRRRHSKHHNKKRLHSVSDSSEEDIPSRKIAKQLKNAVHIQEDKEICQKSLQSRLKGFMEPGNEGKPQSEDEEELSKLRKDALESTTPENSDKQDGVKEQSPKDTVDDKELTELRLEALKSAVIQKHMLRKKLKGEKGALPKSDNEVNKENAQDNINKEIQAQPEKSLKKPTLEENITNNVSTEEDLDVMRAMLLASMSTKIAKIPDPSTTAILPKPITRTINNPTANALRKPMNVIRSVKNNYYSNRAVYKVQNKVTNNNVKVPTVEPLIINLNNDSDSDMDIDPPTEEEDNLSKKVTELLKQERAEVEAKTNKMEPKKVTEKAPTLDKSVLKLLPISQQMEYQKLKQQLINAKKKPRIRRFSQKVSEIKRDTVVVKRNFKSRFVLNKVNSPINKTVRPIVDKNEATVLLKTWNVLQVQMAGRLEMAGKYQELGPLLKKVNQVGAERNYYDNELKRIFQELEITKAKYNSSHQEFKELVEELVRKKECIDKGAPLANRTKLITSTPIRNESKQEKEVLDESLILSKTTACQKNVIKETRKIEDILDPNDINGCLVIQTLQDNKCENVKMPAYISPLDTRQRDSACSDPLATLCPFDLLGVCKDKECTYKHCS